MNQGEFREHVVDSLARIEVKVERNEEDIQGLLKQAKGAGMKAGGATGGLLAAFAIALMEGLRRATI